MSIHASADTPDIEAVPPAMFQAPEQRLGGHTLVRCVPA